MKLVYLLIFVFLLGCQNVNVNDLDPDGYGDPIDVPTAKTFAADVVPIFSKTIGSFSCTTSGCHNATASGGLNLSLTGTALYDAIQSNSRVNTSSPSNSKLLLYPLQSGVGSGHTKLFNSTSDVDYLTILSWIQAGALNN